MLWLFAALIVVVVVVVIIGRNNQDSNVTPEYLIHMERNTKSFEVQVRSNQSSAKSLNAGDAAKAEKTRWEEISEMDIPSKEKIKLVEIQNIPVLDGEQLEAKRKFKKYTVTVVPQAKDCFEYDDTKKITVQVFAGSKEEALDHLSERLSGKRAISDGSNANLATAGRWYDGNMYLLEITDYQRVVNRSKR